MEEKRRMKFKYFRQSPVSSIVLIVMLGFFIWYLASGGYENFTGVLGIVVLFIARGIMWEGWYMEKNQALQEEIDFLTRELKQALRDAK